jgi:hypothetical protein
MIMPIHPKADDVLESVSEGLEANRPAVHALVVQGRNVPYYNYLLPQALRLSQLTLKPSDLVTWVKACLSD